MKDLWSNPIKAAELLRCLVELKLSINKYKTDFDIFLFNVSFSFYFCKNPFSFSCVKNTGLICPKNSPFHQNAPSNLLTNYTASQIFDLAPVLVTEESGSILSNC